MRAYWDCVEAFMGPGHLEWRKESGKMANGKAKLDARHYIVDESLGGIEREYVEVERKADVGDYVVHESAGIHGIFEHTDGIFAFIKFDGSYSGRDAWYLSKTVTVQPTDIVRIGKLVDAETSLCVHERYCLVERPAEVGEKVLITSVDNDEIEGYKIGDIFEAITVFDVTIRIVDTEGERNHVRHHEYRVLEPVEAHPIEPLTVDETQASPQVIDMLAHIAKELAKINRRLDRAEEHIGDAQRNVETFAARAEETRSQTETNTEAIRKLESASDVESGRVRKLDFDKDMLMRDIGSLNKRLEAFINDAK